MEGETERERGSKERGMDGHRKGVKEKIEASFFILFFNFFSSNPIPSHHLSIHPSFSPFPSNTVRYFTEFSLLSLSSLGPVPGVPPVAKKRRQKRKEKHVPLKNNGKRTDQESKFGEFCTDLLGRYIVPETGVTPKSTSPN